MLEQLLQTEQQRSQIPNALKPYASLAETHKDLFDFIQRRHQEIEDLYKQIESELAQCDLTTPDGYLYALQLINTALKKAGKIEEPFGLAYDVAYRVTQQDCLRYLHLRLGLDREERELIAQALGPLFFTKDMESFANGNGVKPLEAYQQTKQTRQSYIASIVEEPFMRTVEQEIRNYALLALNAAKHAPEKENLVAPYSITRDDIIKNVLNAWGWVDRGSPLGLPLTDSNNDSSEHN